MAAILVYNGERNEGEMSQALYRKYRSRSLDEVLGQEQVTAILKRALSGDTISHAFLLTGPHGVGKTSVARILAHEINKLPYSDDAEHLDIIEIDAASNNGVEDVRDLREKVHIAPSSARYKVYIIDEVHMLSKPAFNALLKTLEEPPNHVVFILATTDADKLPATIISRVQRFNFRAIDKPTVAKHLGEIAKKEGIAIDQPALKLIAEHGSGSFRDSIGLLDQLKDSTDPSETINADAVETALGTSPRNVLVGLLEAHRSGSLTDIVTGIKQLEQAGAQASIVAKQLIRTIYDDIASHPEDIALLDQLLEVGQSAHPFIKLLTVMAPAAATPKPVSAPVTKPKVAPKQEEAKPKTKTMAETITPAPSVTLETDVPAPKLAVGTAPAEIDWSQIVTESKPVSMSLFSLLAKAGISYEAPELTIYAGNKFNHKKLEDPKQQSLLAKVLQSVGIDGVTITVTSDKKPPEDAEMAAIANLMGGGEEVAVDG